MTTRVNGRSRQVTSAHDATVSTAPGTATTAGQSSGTGEARLQPSAARDAEMTSIAGRLGRRFEALGENRWPDWSISDETDEGPMPANGNTVTIEPISRNLRRDPAEWCAAPPA